MNEADRQVVIGVRSILRKVEDALRPIGSARELLGAVRGARSVAERMLFTEGMVGRILGKRKKGRFVESMAARTGYGGAQEDFIPGAPPLSPLVKSSGLKQKLGLEDDVD